MSSSEKMNAKENGNKTYINLFFFKITVGALFTYIYLLASIMLNIVNRLLYQ